MNGPTRLGAGAPRRSESPVEQTTVTEIHSKKIVVTTTIRLDGEGDERDGGGGGDPAQEALKVLASTGVAENAALRRMVSEGRLVMMRIGPRTYLGLTNGRRRIQPLRVDDHLFIFAPRQDSLRSLADLVAGLLRAEGAESEFAARDAEGPAGPVRLPLRDAG